MNACFSCFTTSSSGHSGSFCGENYVCLMDWDGFLMVFEQCRLALCGISVESILHGVEV